MASVGCSAQGVVDGKVGQSVGRLKDERCIQDSHFRAFLSPDQKDGKVVFLASSGMDFKLFVGWGK